MAWVLIILGALLLIGAFSRPKPGQQGASRSRRMIVGALGAFILLAGIGGLLPEPQPTQTAQATPPRPLTPEEQVEAWVKETGGSDGVRQVVFKGDTLTVTILAKPAWDERRLAQSVMEVAGKTAPKIFEAFPKVNFYRLSALASFTIEDAYGNRKEVLGEAVRIGISRETNAKANWPVLYSERCRKFISVADEFYAHPTIVLAIRGGTSGCWSLQ